MNKPLLIFDSHPVQYRVPVWKAMQDLYPGCIHVVYGSDCSVRGYNDTDFGQKVAWDEPLLEGYSHTILNSENGIPLSGWGSLTGAGVKEQIAKHNPSAILLTGLNYRLDLAVFIEARRKGIPLWIRSESQDQAFNRSKLKLMIRGAFYRIAYAGIKKFFYIGQLNRLHYKNHGVSDEQLIAAHYCTVDRFRHINLDTKKQLRAFARNKAMINDTSLVVGFSGKFISKKNPSILYKMLEHLPLDLLQRLTLYFIGSGELESDLKRMALLADEKYGVKTFFSGFVNQSGIAEHYLAMDMLVLPSRKMGETWGLVANEAMQAGCGVIVSNAVGCADDFKSWERFSVFEEGNEKALAKSILKLSLFERDFDWATINLQHYSVERVASSLVNELFLDRKYVSSSAFV